MSGRWQDLIPEPLHDPVRAAFASAYGANPVECLGPVAGGASGAVALKMAAGGHIHLLRVEAVAKPMRNPHQYACMAIAAEAGIAPALHYLDAERGVALMDYIAPVPIDRMPGGKLGLAQALGELAARLQATPAFPVLADWRTIVGRLLGFLETRFTPALLARHRQGFEALYRAMPWDEATHVSSHNDPNPRNLLFDGARLWLIDWETACRNDPMVDVAILTDSLAGEPEPVPALLHAWLGRPPISAETRRLEQVRLLTRLYYAGLLVAAGGPAGAPIADLTAPSPAEIAAMAGRSRGIPTPDILLGMAKMLLAEFAERADAAIVG